MKWKTLGTPALGPAMYFEKKLSTAFAFFPHKAEDGKTYWLEWVPVVRFYGPMSESWRVDRWLGTKVVQL